MNTESGTKVYYPCPRSTSCSCTSVSLSLSQITFLLPQVLSLRISFSERTILILLSENVFQNFPGYSYKFTFLRKRWYYFINFKTKQKLKLSVDVLINFVISLYIKLGGIFTTLSLSQENTFPSVPFFSDVPLVLKFS